MSILFYDTCSLLSLQGEVFDTQSKFYVSSITFNELEEIKTSAYKDEELKYSARTLLKLFEQNEDLYEIIIFDEQVQKVMDKLGLPNTNDNKIISCAYSLQKGLKLETVTFCTEDLACKAVAKSIGLSTLLTNSQWDSTEKYKGFKVVTMDDEELAEFYTYSSIPDPGNEYDLLENEYLIIKDKNFDVIDKYKWKDNRYVKIPFQKLESKMFGKVVPKDGDAYQQIAMDSLVNNKITLLRGPAGSGKSYLAFAHLFSLLEKGTIDKIIIFCNTVATKGSAKLGFYPGSRTEKLLDSQIGNLLESKLGDRAAVEALINKGDIVLLPMSDIRGYDTSGMNAAIYITEAQNLDIGLIKLALQRIGEDSICILDGDDRAQVDMSAYAGNNNGIRRVSKVFRGYDIYGEVELQKVQRSKIAEIAEKL